MAEEDGRLIDAVANSEELRIFSSDIVIDYLDFKWTMFARTVHFVGFCFHVCYVVAMFAFIGAAYSGDDVLDDVPKAGYYAMLAAFLIYPSLYDGVQCYKLGREYF